MKVLLINPPSENEILSCNPEIIKSERGYDPPLGLLYLAGYLKKYSDYELKIIDAQVEKLNYPQLEEKIREFNPDVVGVTAMTFTLLDVIKTVEATKKSCPNAKIIIGGPHVQIYAKETANIKNVDFVVLGEGEKIFIDLIENINNLESLKNISGLVFKYKGEIIDTGRPEYFTDLDSLPFPPRELLPYKKYSSLLAKEKIITTIFTSRGCPFACNFCDRPAMGKNFRSRSAKNVVDEMEECLKLDIKEIFIYDDTFTVDRQRVVDICNEITKRNLRFTWDIRARVNTVDEELLRLLKKAGCIRIHFGVEAGTEKILKVLNKNISLEQALTAFKLSKKIGIQTLAYFMIGSPTETEEDVLQTIKFMNKLDPDFVQITLLTPFPGTKIYQWALDQKVFPIDYWREFATNPTPGFKTKYWTKELSREDLERLLIVAYKKFYIRPSYIIKRIKAITSFAELYKKAKAGLRVLIMKKNAF
jgi:radical SAM superfamily enzyme YgiQ (UPF0313 family)